MKGVFIMGPSDITSSSPEASFGIDPEETTPSHTHEEASPQSTGPYQYSYESPVKEISPEHIIQVAKTFSDSIGDYATDHQGQPVSAQQSHDPSAAEKWNERSSDSQEVADGIGLEADNKPEYFEKNSVKAFSYDLGDHSAAVTTLRHNPPITKVEYFATHPATSRAGTTMIEHVVNESQAAGNDGKVKLSSFSGAATGFYNSLGFKSQQNNHLELNPSKSDLWSQGDDGNWKLKEHKGASYLSKKKSSEPSQASSSKRPHKEESDEEASNAKRPHKEESDEEASNAKRLRK